MSITYKEEQTGMLSPEDEVRLKTKEAENDEPEDAENQESAENNQDGADNDDEGAFIVGEWDMTELANEFIETGELSDESYAELEKNGFQREVVDLYIAGYKAQAGTMQDDQNKPGQNGFTTADEQELIAGIGGQQKYEAITAWAEKKLTEEERIAYNKAVLESKDKNIAKLAMDGLKARYEREYGNAPKLMKQTTSRPMNEGYVNRDEMLAAMRDPRYGKEKSYTKSVEEKLRKSTFVRG